MWKALMLKLGHFIQEPPKQKLVLPPITQYMKERGLVWAHIKGTNDFIMVCDFCGGNCGQCGNTDLIGNVSFDMQRLWDNSPLKYGSYKTAATFERSA
jgi:hypothetical protein